MALQSALINQTDLLNFLLVASNNKSSPYVMFKDRAEGQSIQVPTTTTRSTTGTATTTPTNNKNTASNASTASNISANALQTNESTTNGSQTRNSTSAASQVVHSPKDKKNSHNAASDAQDAKKYLVFLSHSGYSNQLKGLKRAAMLAYQTGRVLVLPPIVPHHTEARTYKINATRNVMPRANASDYFVLTKAVSVGTESQYCERRTYLLNHLKRQGDFLAWYAKKKKRTGIPYVSHAQLMNVPAITNATGVEMIDFPEFMRKPSSYTTDTWSFGKDPLLDYNGDCDEGQEIADSNKTSEILKRFEQNFGKDRIAVIGSAFRIAKDVSAGKEIDANLADNFEAFPLNPNLTCLVSHLRSKLPESGYLGLHIRFKDQMDLGKSCEKSPDAMSLYEKALEPYLSQRQEKDRDMQHNKTSNTTRTAETVFVGMSNQLAKTCFQKYARNATRGFGVKLKAVNVNDMITNDSTAQTLLSHIRVDRPTLLLILDQLMLSLANEMLFANYLNFGSTYQGLIMKRHEKKEQNWAGLNSPMAHCKSLHMQKQR